MSLSPDDIVGYRFKQALRGYAIDEVDELLDRLADQVERTDAEIEELRARARAAEEQAVSAKRTEEALRRTLVTAQETAERVVSEAESEAETLRAEAGSEAERIRREAEEHAREVVASAETAARHEADAARARVEEAAHRHEQVLVGVADQRDALRRHLAQLDDLVEAGVPATTAAASASGLVAGELAGGAAPSDGGAQAGEGQEPVEQGEGQVDAGEVPVHGGPTGTTPDDDEEGVNDVAPPAPDSLRVRVHDDATDPSALLGSERRGGS